MLVRWQFSKEVGKDRDLNSVTFPFNKEHISNQVNITGILQNGC